MGKARKGTPSAERIAKYWISDEGYKRQVEIKEKYAPDKEEKQIYFAWDLESPHCFACNKETGSWSQGLQRCHIIPFSMTENQNVDNFILMCPDCHQASPTTDNIGFFWKWVRNRTSYEEEMGKLLEDYLSPKDAESYYYHLFEYGPNASIFFDDSILSYLGKLSDAVFVGGKYPKSSIVMGFAEIIQYNTPPSKLFNVDEMNSFYQKKKSFLDVSEREDYEDLLTQVSLEYQKRLDEFNQLSEQQQKQRIEELKRFNNEESKAFADMKAMYERVGVQ